VFFMLSSLALTRLQGLPVNLPQASSATKQNAMDFTVTIDKQLRVFVNKTSVTIDQLGQTLMQMAGPNADLSQASVVINADETVPYGLVIQCIDEARNVGITHFPLATKPESQKQT
jgi:biopolymer transport protein ExbD